MTSANALSKVLSANDLGLTGSHQAGLFIPRFVVSFFPLLDVAALNPDAWLEVAADERRDRWRLVYYNNGVVAGGTRDEYRVTHCHQTLRALGAGVGDTLLLRREASATYVATLVSLSQDPPAMLVLHTNGPWRRVRI